jgi:ankyrin repeat protein
LSIPYHEQIQDLTFRRAIELIDSGDVAALSELLAEEPALARQRVTFDGDRYFRNPSLLEFLAENPIRRGTLPANIVDVARTIIAAGAESRSIDDTLGLVASGRVARECNVQLPLIELLCESGANPSSALHTAAAHGEFAAIDELIRRGAKPDLPTLAAQGNTKELLKSLPSATMEQRHLALAFAAQYGHSEIVGALLDAGENPNRFNPPGAHSHSTPLHQAALAGHLNVVKSLVERGANLDAQDLLWKGTPLGWARHGNQKDVEAFLQARAESQPSK